MTTTVAPAGIGNLTPYLLVSDVDAALAFYATAFGAATTSRDTTPNGVHSSFMLGDSMLMMGGPVAERKAMLHLYVDDLEDTIRRALDLGATSTYPITQASYGERFGVVEDPAGNAWIVAERATSMLRHPDMKTVTPYLNPVGAAELVEFLGDPEDGASAFPVMFYLYVASADATYEQALKAGALSIHPPAKQHYGEYVAAFTDPAGNQWYVAEHTVDT